MKYLKLIGFPSLLISFILIGRPGFAQDNDETGEDKNANISEIVKAINKYPDSLALHEEYLKASGFTSWGAKDDPLFTAQYKKWMAKYPKSATLPYALGHAYAQKESPNAKPWLLKAIKLNPALDKAYFDLWLDAERWGQFEKGQEYIRKASEIKPDDPNYAFYYASGFDNSNPEKYKKLSLEVAKRFPESERGAQALYWLGARSKDIPSKIKYYELLKEKYSPAKFGWSSSGMMSLYDLLLIPSPDKALKLAIEMAGVVKNERDQKFWSAQKVTSLKILKAQNLIEMGKASEAIKVLDSVKLPRNPDFIVFKAKAFEKANQPVEAYNLLLEEYAKNPSNEIGKALFKYGASIQKSNGQVDKEVEYIRDTAAKKATDFSLNQYFEKGKKSLKDYEGKVILLTYWFPGCGPCRGEFPHFQNVVNKFKGQDLVYLGINIVPEQNDYVIPFLRSSGYTFIPLEDFEGRNKGNLDNRNAAPMNFLIDKTGRVVFKNFRTDGDNEDVLENMISALLKQG